MRTFFILAVITCTLAACNPEIGDECTFDYDCSQNYDRNCDLSQPAGYCLIITCEPDECPEEAACVNYTAPCPEVGGEPIADCSLIAPNRGRSFCLRHCKSNDDCRDKYKCVDPIAQGGEIIDLKSSKQKICVPAGDD